MRTTDIYVLTKFDVLVKYLKKYDFIIFTKTFMRSKKKILKMRSIAYRKS